MGRLYRSSVLKSSANIQKSPRAALYEGIIWGFYSVNGRVSDSQQHFYRVRRWLYLIRMIKFPHLIVCGGKLQCLINGNCAKFVGRALRDSVLQKKIAVSKSFTYCDSIILPLFSSENQFTSLLRSQHLGYLPCRFAARRLGHLAAHPVRSLVRPVGQPAPGHRISPLPC